MSLRMVMSLTSNLAEEPADDEGQLTLDLAVDPRSSAPSRQTPQPRAEQPGATTEWASERIDAALDEMRDFLTDMHPASDAEALHSLRLAFPTIPLTERIAAIRTRFFA